MKNGFKLAALVLMAWTAVACGNKKTVSLTEGEWHLHSMTYGNGDDHVITDNRPTLVFSDSTSIHGMAGCNNYFGRYETDGKKLHIDIVGLTLKMCPDMEMEDNFVKQMGNVTNYAIDGQQLYLYNDDKNVFFKFELNGSGNAE